MCSVENVNVGSTEISEWSLYFISFLDGRISQIPLKQVGKQVSKGIFQGTSSQAETMYHCQLILNNNVFILEQTHRLLIVNNNVFSCSLNRLLPTSVILKTVDYRLSFT